MEGDTIIYVALLIIHCPRRSSNQIPLLSSIQFNDLKTSSPYNQSGLDKCNSLLIAQKRAFLR